MWRTLTSIVFGLLMWTHSSPVSASPQGFAGEWVNRDPATRSIHRVVVGFYGDAARIHAFGACHPSDCDWGEVPMRFFAPGPQGGLENAQSFLAEFNMKGQSQLLVGIMRNDGSMILRSYTLWADGGSRSNYVNNNSFVRR